MGGASPGLLNWRSGVPGRRLGTRGNSGYKARISMCIDLTGFTILDVYGTDRIDLNGEYSAESLIKICTDSWVPYLECDRKCWRSPFCGFAQEDPKRAGRTQEILCEVGFRAVRYFILYTFEIFKKLDRSLIQNYLDALYHYYKFVFESEITIGGYINENSFKFMGPHAPASVGFIRKIRPHIDSVCNLLQDIPDFWAKDSIIFVEGEAEEAFLNKLKSTHFYDIIDINVKSYDGKGNKKIRRIEMMLLDYKQRGYNIYIQGDADGSNQDIFRELERREIITQSDKFVFKYDFESSIPPCLLLDSLQSLGFLSELKKSKFIKDRKKYSGSVKSFLEEKYSISIDPVKVSLGHRVADILTKTFDWWNDEEFMSTELGEFINFVRRMR